jgi:hypothetical protein
VPTVRAISLKAKNGTRAMHMMAPMASAPTSPPPPICGMLSVALLPWYSPTAVSSAM